MEDVHSGKQRTVVLYRPVGEEYFSEETITKVENNTFAIHDFNCYLNTARQNIDIFTSMDTAADTFSLVLSHYMYLITTHHFIQDGTEDGHTTLIL